MRKFRDHLANRVYRAGVDVQLGITVTKETIEQFSRDALLSHEEAIRLMKPESVDIRCSTRVTEVTEHGVRAIGPDGGEKFFEADDIYYALGFRALLEELAELRSVCARTAVTGDCLKPARILQAARDGMFAAMDIE